ncbi:hypothetical protein [Paraburkholderia acidisoli]|uniref:Uncharacterized protein n=1 Tax=Paraburkholderia acidisoli TaxID=2571748 RepID=A0A7Z2GNM2_9BURK|nr:hypothetical protein [Paraburkholderia acidisoli]QGZ65116.1 hypothetical protein FAZ98_25375 [Paraburkholderia acidisoli]
MLQEYVSARNRVQNAWQGATRLSSFKEALADWCRAISANQGVSLETSDRAVTHAFFAWTQVLENAESHLHRNAPDYYQFLCGALLAELLRHHAVHALPSVHSDAAPHPAHPVHPDQPGKPGDAIAQWWPEGYALTHFCVDLVRKVTAQECAQIVAASGKLGNIKVWQSFRENLLEEPSIAIAYFDDFMGVAPNWRNPCFVGERAAARH